MRRVHTRLREALAVVRAAGDADEGDAGDGLGGTAIDDLLLYCVGFCTALDAHHRGEDRTLFPAIEAAHPELADVLRALRQDHSMLAHLIGGLRAAAGSGASRAELDRHLDGIEAVMETHFRYEERQLLTVLEALALDATSREALGPL